MKRLLLIGFAAIALAALPTLSASAMPSATPNTLIGDSDDAVILVRGGHGGGHGGWDEAVMVIITDGAEAAAITMVDAGNPQYRAQEEALS